MVLRKPQEAQAAQSSSLPMPLDWPRKLFNDVRGSYVRRYLMKGNSQPLKSLLKAVRRLMNSLKQFTHEYKNDPLLVFVFDEASSLLGSELLFFCTRALDLN